MISMKTKVLVTGGAGFIAHKVIDLFLKRTDWQIISLDRLDFSGNLNRLDEVINIDNPIEKTRVKIVYHDLKAEFNDQICNSIGDVDYIFHIAAASHVDRSINNPLSFVMDNVVGTCNVLNFARKCTKLKRFINFSTDEVFGPAPLGVAYKERDRYNSTNPYSASKAGAEELAVAYHNTYDLPVYICHTVNVFGPRQHPEKYIPKCIRHLLNNEIVNIHSDPLTKKSGSRFYIHVEDVAEALLFILSLDETKLERDFGDAKCPKFNIAGFDEISNLEVAKTIADCMGVSLNYKLVDFNGVRPGLDFRYSLSGDYLKSLGWSPKLTWQERIKDVVEWTLRNTHWL